MQGLYAEVETFVESLAPTWRKGQRRNLTAVLRALDERPSLCLSEVARALPARTQPLHGRLKRLTRFLANPRLDEGALFARWLRLSYRFCSELSPADDATTIRSTHLLPILLDTVYFEPFAVLLATVPCGSRGLPIALTSYHRSELAACLPTRAAWPRATLMDYVPPRRAEAHDSTKRELVAFTSQNLLEARLIDLVYQMCCTRLTPVLVADRGFARASLFQQLLADGRHFVIRIDAETHIAFVEEGPTQAVATLAPREGETLWLEEVYYQQTERVPVNLLALREPQQHEAWYLVSNLPCAAWVAELYRWRMRIECTNRDTKSGLLLREGGDVHRLQNVWHLHTLMLALACAEWWHALVGLQAWHELPAREIAAEGASEPPHRPNLGPAQPPPVLPHRSLPLRPPRWMRLFTARGWLSYVRLGFEVCRVPDFHWLVHRMVRWLAAFLLPLQPLWRPWQRRYRLRAGWFVVY